MHLSGKKWLALFGTLIILKVTGGVVGAFKDVEINTLWGNSVPYVCWNQELVCCDHKSASTEILILKYHRFIPCPPCSPVCSCNFYLLSLGHPESHPVAYSVICLEVSDFQ